MMLVIFRVFFWLLVSVTVCVGLVVPSAWAAKLKLVGLTAAGRIPVPFKLTVGFAPAFVEMVSVPIRVPKAVGVKYTEMVQLPFPARVLGLMGHAFVNE